MLLPVSFSRSDTGVSPLLGTDPAVRQWQVGCGTPQPSPLQRSAPAPCKPRLARANKASVPGLCVRRLAVTLCHFAVLACTWGSKSCTLSHWPHCSDCALNAEPVQASAMPTRPQAQQAAPAFAARAAGAAQKTAVSVEAVPSVPLGAHVDTDDLWCAQLACWPAAKSVRRQAVMRTHTTVSTAGPRASVGCTRSKGWC